MERPAGSGTSMAGVARYAAMWLREVGSETAVLHAAADDA